MFVTVSYFGRRAASGSVIESEIAQGLSLTQFDNQLGTTDIAVRIAQVAPVRLNWLSWLY